MKSELLRSTDLQNSIRGSSVYIVFISKCSNYENHFTIMHGKNDEEIESNADKYFGKYRWSSFFKVPNIGNFTPSINWFSPENVDNRSFVSFRTLSECPIKLKTEKIQPLSYGSIEKLYTSNYKISVSWDYLETQLESYSRDMKVNLDPDYQRAHCWETERQSAYVEYILSGGNHAKELQWNSPGWMEDFSGKEIELVDGKQRLQAVTKFMNNELKVFKHYTKSSILGHLPMDASFTFSVHGLKTKKEVLKLYLQINSGGIAHTKEELEKVQQLLEKEKQHEKE